MQQPATNGEEHLTALEHEEDSYTRYRTIYRAYRIKYKRYLRQTLKVMS
jgi:hypothetical protein